MELSQKRLQKKSSHRSRTSSLPPPSSASTEDAQETPPLYAPLARKSDDSTPRDYNLPIPSQMAIPDDYERDNNDNNKYEKFK